MLIEHHLGCSFVGIIVTGVSVVGLYIPILVMILMWQKLRNTILLHQITIIATSIAHMSFTLFLPSLQPRLKRVFFYYVLQLLAAIIKLIFKDFPSGPFIIWNCTVVVKIVWHWSFALWSSW